MGPPLGTVLTVNAGSSSIKLAVFDLEAEPRSIATGAIDLEAHEASLVVGPGAPAERIPMPTPVTTDAVAALLARWLARVTPARVSAVVHRIVHGGERFHAPCVLTPDVVAALAQLEPLAPNHLPGELALVRGVGTAMPGVTQIAAFDTAFHHGLPDEARTLPIGGARELGLRRFGFHGLSYTYLMSVLEREGASAGRVVLAHLGSGASLAAVRDGRCIDTSMGLTPYGGLVMSTRPGDLDPGAVVYVARQQGLSADDLERVLARESGLLAMSGTTPDMEHLLAREQADARARLAISVFCYQARKWIGAFAAALGGLDTLVFSGGIGEHAPEIRARITEPLGFLGLELDGAANRHHEAVISTARSRVAVRVIPTDEALVMARLASALLAGQPSTSPRQEADR